MNQPRVAIYVRVSTELQSNDMQLQDLNTYALARQLSVHKIYEDQISGTKEERPGLDQLMKDAKKRKFDIVLVWRFIGSQDPQDTS